MENLNCTLCDLHENATDGSVCLKGEGSDVAKLLIFLDAPNLVEDRRHRGFVSDGADLLKWMLRRMSVQTKDYYLDYVIKCYTKGHKPFSKKANRLLCIESCSLYRFATLQRIRPRTVVAMGSLACEAFFGSDKAGNFEGTKWNPSESRMRDYVGHIWATYSPAYALQDPSESVGIYRTLWQASLDAGLKPQLNKTVKPFDYGY